MRRPGFETRLMPTMVFLRSSEYFKLISSCVPGLPSTWVTVKPEMNPSRSRILARFSFNFELGILTLSNMAAFALRMRVSMSAMGSVIVIAVLLPTCLRHAGDLAGVDHLPQADPAQTELAVHRARTSAALATGIGPRRELRGLL